MEDDHTKRNKLFILIIWILISLYWFCIGYAIRDSKIKEVSFEDTIINATVSPLFVPTQIYGTYMTENGEVNTPKMIDYVSMVEEIVNCESGGEMKWGDLNYKENGVSIPSYGVAQFQLRTFNMLKIRANKPLLNYYSATDQRWLLQWALVNGYGKLWTCARDLGYI